MAALAWGRPARAEIRPRPGERNSKNAEFAPPEFTLSARAKPEQSRSAAALTPPPPGETAAALLLIVERHVVEHVHAFARAEGEAEHMGPGGDREDR